MQQIDYIIVAVYLACLVVCGAVLARRANQGTDAYFLGGRKIPWWALGASGMSSNLDAAGTMTIITLIYTFGLHGFFIEMRGGVVLPIAVFLAFMGKWHQRSGVMTTAEWMRLRFGSGLGGRTARMLAAFTYLVITVGMVVFFIAASGKFLAVFLPFTTIQCSVGMALLALGYTMISGIHGVIWTDVFQPLFPRATDRAALVVSYAASIGIVALGLLLALRADASILEVWVLIVIQLFPAFLVPFALRWYWGRMNGWGFSGGIVFGFSASFGLVISGAGGILNEVQILGCIAAISSVGCVLGTLLTAPVDGDVLRGFYDRVRPFGWWPREWTAKHQAEHRRDGWRLGAGLIWQTMTFLIPMLLVLRHYSTAIALAVGWAGLGLLLLRTIHED